MKTTEVIWRNGQFVPWADAQIHVLSHTLHYGGGAFEGIRFYNTPKGPAIFRLQDHIERLYFSMQTLKMVVPYSQEEVISVIKELVRCSKLEAGYIRPIVFYGYSKMGVNPIGNPVEFVIACWPWGAYLPHDRVDVKTSKYIRIHPDSTEVEAKLCGHYVNGILASLELQGTHYHEALLLDSHGYITEGVGENFFMVKDKVIYTPNLGGILAGITRATVIELARSLDIQLIEADITLYDAYQADEAFFTGTAAEVTEIRSINDKIIGKIDKESVALTIKKAYLELVQGKNNAFNQYLTYV